MLLIGGGVRVHIDEVRQLAEKLQTPVLTTTSSSFGTIQSTRFPTGDFGSARQIQFALKLLF